jgi:hypothetical protein
MYEFIYIYIYGIIHLFKYKVDNLP